MERIGNGKKYRLPWRATNDDHLLDPTTITLLYLSRHSLMPELYETVGPEAFVKLIENFGGTTLEIPKIIDLKFATMDATIYSRLRSSNCDKDVIRELAGRYSTIPSKILERYLNVCAEFAKIEESQLLIESKKDELIKEQEKLVHDLDK